MREQGKDKPLWRES